MWSLRDFIYGFCNLLAVRQSAKGPGSICSVLVGCGNVWHVFYVCFLCLMLCLADCPCDTEDTCVRAAHHVKICENRLPISEDLHVAIVCWLHCIWLYCLPLMWDRHPQVIYIWECIELKEKLASDLHDIFKIIDVGQHRRHWRRKRETCKGVRCYASGASCFILQVSRGLPVHHCVSTININERERESLINSSKPDRESISCSCEHVLLRSNQANSLRPRSMVMPKR